MLKINTYKEFKSIKNIPNLDLVIRDLEKSAIKDNKIKSLKIIRQGNKYFKNKKMRKFSILYNKNLKDKNINLDLNKFDNSLLFSDRKYIKNNKTFDDSNKDSNIKNNISTMKDIINKLMRIRQKINEINIQKTKNNNLTKLYKSFKNNPNIQKKISSTKNYFYSPKLKSKNKNIEIDNNNENKNNYNNTEVDFNLFNKKLKLNKFHNLNNRKPNLKLKLSLDDKVNNNQNRTRTLSLNKDISNYAETSYKIYKNHSQNILNDHIRYIDKIRDSEFINLFQRFQKSLKKSEKEKIIHLKSLVFPSNIINSLIKMKKELILDKYRIEYLSKIDTYNYNPQKIIKAFGYHNNSTINNDNNKEIELKNGNNNIGSDNTLNKNNIKNKLKENLNDKNISKIHKANDIKNNSIEKLDLNLNFNYS